MEISPANDAGKLGGTTQYDLAASYRMGELAPSLEGLTLKASAQNVTNKETLTCYDATNCWIGRDRTFSRGELQLLKKARWRWRSHFIARNLTLAPLGRGSGEGRYCAACFAGATSSFAAG